MFDETPVLEPRRAADFLAALERRRASFLPEWRSSPHDAGAALQRVVARYAQVIGDRLNQAPDRSFLAFLDLLGISLLPARPARAPIVFKTFAGMGDGRAPAGTRVGAQVPGSSSPLVFETESAIALAAARLTDIVTIWPDRDAAAVHSPDATGGRPFTLFRPLSPVPHEIYLAHDRVFDVGTDAVIELAIELASGSDRPIDTIWEYWDGQVWQAFKAFDAADPVASSDGTAGFVRSGTIALRPGCGKPTKTTVANIEAVWLRGRVAAALPPDPTRVLPLLDRIRVRARVNHTVADLLLDAAFHNTVALDPTSTFHPFGTQALTGDAFYLRQDEVFGKPGATVVMSWNIAAPFAAKGLAPSVQWHYWNGARWLKISDLADTSYFAESTAQLHRFTLPEDAALATVNGQTGGWIRAQLVAGRYGRLHKVPLTPPPATMDVTITSAPVLRFLHLAYDWRPAFQSVEQCCTHNDFQFTLRSDAVRWPGQFFAPFTPVADATPSIYLGFDAPLPNDLVSLYLDVDESDDDQPALVWEAWDGERWRELSLADDTRSMQRPGVVSFVPPAGADRPQAAVRLASERDIVVASALDAARFQPGQLITIAQADTIESARLAQVDQRTLRLETPLQQRYSGGTLALAAWPRFGTPRDWVRARLKENGAPPAIRVNGVHVNATWALQTQTMSTEVLGSGNGQPAQTLFFSQFPVLPGEDVEVRELDGARASVELPMLRDELLAAGFTADDIRTVVEPRSGRVREVWVRWRARPHLYFSSASDRHYVIERARGRIVFGDAVNGRLPAAGVDNIRARVYRAGGGVAGNVARGAIDQMLGGAFAEGVSNPRAAGGGADGESPPGVRDRGPDTLRHRWRALTAKDYEAMAREASPGVAAVRVLPATAPNGRPAAGWVTVIIVPQSRAAVPQPSLELRQQVHDYLMTRAAGTVSRLQVAVIGPTYRRVGVAALVTSRVRGEAGLVSDRIDAALRTFLHPLTGGPEGRGWSFGRDVFLSDVAAIVEAVAGVDYVRQLDLLLDDAPVGPRVMVPPDRIVVAGDLRIEMEARDH